MTSKDRFMEADSIHKNGVIIERASNPINMVQKTLQKICLIRSLLQFFFISFASSIAYPFFLSAPLNHSHDKQHQEQNP